MGFTGLETTIIDYTLSRAHLDNADEVATNRRAGEDADFCTVERLEETFDTEEEKRRLKKASDVAFLDLEADPALFEGDGSVDTQYDVYRQYVSPHFFFPSFLLLSLSPTIQFAWARRIPHNNFSTNTSHSMRAALFTSDPLASVAPPPLSLSSSSTNNTAATTTTKKSKKAKQRKKTKDGSHHDADKIKESNPNTAIENSPWRTFHPQTNLIWLGFVLGRLMGMLDERERRLQKEKKNAKKLKGVRKERTKERDEEADRIIETGSGSASQMKMEKETQTETETGEKKKLLLNRRARVLTRTLRRVQRALELDALAGRGITTAATSSTTAAAATAAARITRETRDTTSSRRTRAGNGNGNGIGNNIGPSEGSASTGTNTSTSTVQAQAQAQAQAQTSVRSTTELVGWAVAEGWLDLEDVLL